jgi:hypothetical protein
MIHPTVLGPEDEQIEQEPIHTNNCLSDSCKKKKRVKDGLVISFDEPCTALIGKDTVKSGY